MKLNEIQEQKLADLANAVDQLKAAEDVYEEKKAEAKEAKEDYEACRDTVTSISKDLRDIQRGTYQPELPFEGPGRETSPTVEINGIPVGDLAGLENRLEKAAERVRKERAKA